MPKAVARRRENQVTSDDMEAWKTALEPVAATTDCARKNW